MPLLPIGLGVLALVSIAASKANPGTLGAAGPPGGAPLTVKVLVLNYDPLVRSEGGRRLHDVCRWNDPRKLAAGYTADLADASGGFARFRVVEWRDLDEFPPKKDGFRYTEEEYLSCVRAGSGWHEPDGVDYVAIFDAQRVWAKVNAREVDEVWLFGAPYFGYWESHMVGPRAYWCNSPPLHDHRVSRNFIVMGFNYERGVGEMLENFGHRVESIMSHVYGGWSYETPPDQQTTWGRFTLYDKVAPGLAACGNVHFAPNSEADYDWGNPRAVWSTCDDWLSYPNLTGRKRLVTCADWGGGDIRAHHRWWLAHLPRAPGRGPDGKLANWWKYVIDYNRYPESRGP